MQRDGGKQWSRRLSTCSNCCSVRQHTMTVKVLRNCNYASLVDAEAGSVTSMGIELSLVRTPMCVWQRSVLGQAAQVPFAASADSHFGLRSLSMAVPWMAASLLESASGRLFRAALLATLHMSATHLAVDMQQLLLSSPGGAPGAPRRLVCGVLS